MRAVADLQLAEQPPGVGLDGVLGQVQVAADLRRCSCRRPSRSAPARSRSVSTGASGRTPSAVRVGAGTGAGDRLGQDVGDVAHSSSRETSLCRKPRAPPAMAAAAASRSDGEREHDDVGVRDARGRAGGSPRRRRARASGRPSAPGPAAPSGQRASTSSPLATVSTRSTPGNDSTARRRPSRTARRSSQISTRGHKRLHRHESARTSPLDARTSQSHPAGADRRARSALEQRAHVRPCQPLVPQSCGRSPAIVEHRQSGPPPASARLPRRSRPPSRAPIRRPRLPDQRQGGRDLRRGSPPGATSPTASSEPDCSSATPWKSRPLATWRGARAASAPLTAPAAAQDSASCGRSAEQRDLRARPSPGAPAGATSRRRDRRASPRAASSRSCASSSRRRRPRRRRGRASVERRLAGPSVSARPRWSSSVAASCAAEPAVDARRGRRGQRREQPQLRRARRRRRPRRPRSAARGRDRPLPPYRRRTPEQPGRRSNHPAARRHLGASRSPIARWATPYRRRAAGGRAADAARSPEAASTIETPLRLRPQPGACRSSRARSPGRPALRGSVAVTAGPVRVAVAVTVVGSGSSGLSTIRVSVVSSMPAMLRGVAHRRAGDLDRVDDAGRDQVDVLAGGGVETVAGRRSRTLATAT